MRKPALIDTNIVISGLITSDADSTTARIFDGMLKDEFRNLMSEKPLIEYADHLLLEMAQGRSAGRSSCRLQSRVRPQLVMFRTSYSSASEFTRCQTIVSSECRQLALRRVSVNVFAARSVNPSIRSTGDATAPCRR